MTRDGTHLQRTLETSIIPNFDATR